jgi:uncharacterized membrane protein
MRVEAQLPIKATPAEIWEYITEPSNTLHFMSGITRWEVESEEKRTGLGARYKTLMKVGTAEAGGLVEIVEWAEPSDLAWSSITGIDQRGRWRLRRIDEERTMAKLRLQWGSPGGLLGVITDRVAAGTVRRHLQATLRSLKRNIEAERLRRANRAKRAAAATG